MTPIRTMLAEDHALVRAGIRALLKAMPDVEVVAEAADGREAVALARRHRPDVVLMDIAMPGLNGLDAAGMLAKDVPGVRVLVLSMHAQEEYVRRALRMGATGYVLKGADPAELEQAVRTVARGEVYLASEVSKRVLDDYRNRLAHEAHPLDSLSPRQREILQLIAEGRSTKDIAHLLALSVKTVETHRSHVMARLDIYDIPGLVRFAIRVGLVAPEA